jgi:hypothetical protein
MLALETDMKKRVFIIYGLCMACMTSPAFAMDLTVELSAPVLLQDNRTKKEMCITQPEPGQKCADKRAETLGDLVQFVLQTPVPAGPNQPDIESFKAGSLGARIYDKDRPAVRLDEAQMILRRADKLSPPLLPIEVFRLHEAFEPTKSQIEGP